MFKKRVVLMTFLCCFVFIGHIKYESLIPFTPYQNIFNLSLGLFSSFDSRDLSNVSYVCDTLKNLFVETVYINFVKEELQSLKSISIILQKPFVDFWIVSRVINFIVRKLVYLSCDIIRKLVVNFTRIFIYIPFLYVLLFYFKTHLKTHRFAPMVLRC